MRFGFVKPFIDVHTLGMASISGLVKSCGYYSVVCNPEVSHALDNPDTDDNAALIAEWLRNHRITHLGFSFRLHPEKGQELFGKLMKVIQNHDIAASQIKLLAVAGLPDLCRRIGQEYSGRVITFNGSEDQTETLIRLGIPLDDIPLSLKESYEYNRELENFGNRLIAEGSYLNKKPAQLNYPEFGKPSDNILLRSLAKKSCSPYPVFRAHAGPFLPDRNESLKLFGCWLDDLSGGGFLDVLSIGSSQLSQSRFGSDWDNHNNGGGVPFNSEKELAEMLAHAAPMLLRAYSGTRNVKEYAEMLHRSIRNAWHALSLWWFNRLDGRGPLTLRQGLEEHCETIRYAASVNDAFEPNTGHHFSFRGADDLSSVVATLLAVKLAKISGIKTVILQSMLNTPRNISFIQDIIKSRTLLTLASELESTGFRVLFQPRAGLDYFAPDTDKARVQLAAVTALMTDITEGYFNPADIIHVVSFSEGVGLADPPVINESIRICQAVIEEYPQYRQKTGLEHFAGGKEIDQKVENMVADARIFIHYLETEYPNLYSPAGLYDIFRNGVLPVPFLWECREEFPDAVNWNTALINGAVTLVNSSGNEIGINHRISMLNSIKQSKDLT